VNRWPQAVAAFALVLSSLDCNDSSGPGVGTTPSKIALVSAINAAGYGAGTTIPTPIIIRVTDHRGLPVPNVEVFFSADRNGFVNPDPVVSDGAGNAVTQWTLGAQAGANILVVSVPSVPSIAPLSVTTATVPGQIADVIIKPPAATIAQGSTLHLEGYAADKYGNPLNGIPITWTSSDASVATVSGGLLTAIGPGLATISASYVQLGATMVVSVPVPSGPGGPGIPAFSIAISVADDSGITVLRSDGTVESRIICGSECEYLTRPNWSRDGSKLSLTGKRGDSSILFVANRDGSDLHEVASTPKLHIIQSKGSFDYWPQFQEDWSAGNQLVYVRLAATASIEIVNADGTGRQTIMTTPGSVASFSDLLRLTNTRWGLGDAMITAAIGGQLYAMDADGMNARQLTTVGVAEHVWSPDGTTIAFITAQGNQATVSLVDPISASVHSIVVPPAGAFCWKPNSLELSFASMENEIHGWQSIYAVHPDGSGLRKIVPVITELEPITHSWSPDGGFLVYPDDRFSAGGANGAQLYAESIDQGTNTRLSDILNVNSITIAGTRCTRGIL
jgi:Tol biopolymer transport system component